MSEIFGTQASADGVLAALPFSDLYLESNGRAWFKTYANDPKRHPVVDVGLEAVQQLRVHLGTIAKRDFRVKWDGMSMRGARFESADGDMYVLRRSLPKALDFRSLGYGKRVEDAFLASNGSGGQLYIITGGTSSGKTVGMTAWVVERMRRFGGAGFTIENPIEVEIEGEYVGESATGTLYQKEIDDDADFGPEIRRRLRAAPNLLMIGELRTSEAVAQAMLAATSGVVVGATYHAADQITGLQRLAGMVRDAGFDPGLFANSLAGVVHQRMTMTTRNGELHRQLHVSPLIIAGSRNEAMIRSQLHGTDFRQLASEVDRQKRVMASTMSDVEF